MSPDDCFSCEDMGYYYFGPTDYCFEDTVVCEDEGCMICGDQYYEDSTDIEYT